MNRQLFLIIEISNQYNVLTYLLDEFQNYLEENTEFMVRRARTQEEVIEALAVQPEYIFSLQAACFDWRMSDNKYWIQEITEMYDVKIIGWLVDSPYYHIAKIKGVNENIKLAAVDFFAADYIKKNFNVDCRVLHHFGAESKWLPMSERDIDVFIPISWSSPVMYETRLQVELQEYEWEIVQKALELLLQDKHLLVEESLEQTLAFRGIKLTRDEYGDLIEWFEKMIDGYYRVKQRERAVLALLQTGVSVAVCGRGWDNFESEHGEYSQLTVFDTDLPFADVVDMMGRSKIVMNIVPTYHEGIHERLATAMLQGAVCLTDPSLFLEKNFSNSENILFFQWDNLKKTMCDAIHYLKDINKLQDMAENACIIAEKEMSVARFTEQVLEMIK